MTFSIVARCPDTGLLGVAVSSAVPAVGSMCPFVRANVGSISTQSWVNPYLAIRALNMMEAGASAQESLDTVLQADDARDLRQIGLVDSRGQAASWTGGACTEWAGHIVGNGFAIQGNMLVSQGTVDAMEKAFMHAIHNDLSERLLCALEAGQLAGGDKRGRQSACLKVIAEEDYPLWDIRVDEHAHPVKELRRVYNIAKLQLLPLIESMPKRIGPGTPAAESVVRMLALSPPDRPGGGGSAK